ncbi:MAG: hypothetical protein KIH65_004300 [Candidatus Uhrbacteria bacterium]|nr:hypothetical protein [Candidatus Uhrbacteria bacterium]
MNFLNQINWSVPTWDLFIAILFAVGALLYGLSMGRDRVIVILISVYMALAVVGNAPILRDINAFQISLNGNYAIKIGFFLGAFLVLFFLISRSALIRTIGSNSAPGSWWQTLAFSILQVGLFISIGLSFLPTDLSSHLTPITREIFLSYWGRSAWLILPIVFMAIAPKQASSIG